MPIRGLIQEGEGTGVGSVSPWPNKCTLGSTSGPFGSIWLCERHIYPHFLQRINGLASRVTDLECVPFHRDALNSLDLWEVVSDNEEKFLSVAACMQPHSLPWGKWGCLGCLFEYWPFDYMGMKPGAGHLNSKEFILHALQQPPLLPREQIV